MFRIDSDCFEAFPTRLNPSAGINDVDFSTVQVSPNPSREALRIVTPVNPLNVSVFNALGQEMHVNWTNHADQSLDIQHLAPGIYLLKLTFANGTKSFRFVKE